MNIQTKSKKKILPTPKSSVALNSFFPANRLTSVAAVLKASSIPLGRSTQNRKCVYFYKQNISFMLKKKILPGQLGISHVRDSVAVQA